MLEREPLGAVALALRKSGGAAGTDQLAATTGLSRLEVLEELRELQARGEVVAAADIWQAVQVA